MSNKKKGWGFGIDDETGIRTTLTKWGRKWTNLGIKFDLVL